MCVYLRGWQHHAPILSNYTATPPDLLPSLPLFCLRLSWGGGGGGGGGAGGGGGGGKDRAPIFTFGM